MGITLLATQEFYPAVLLPLHLGQTAAWLIMLLATPIAVLLIWPVAAALRRIPHGTLIDLTEIAVGRWGSIAFALALVPTLSFMAGLILRQTSEMAVTAAFPHTPQTFATTTLLLGAVFVAYGDGHSLVRLGRLMLPPVILSLVLIAAGTVGWGNLYHLLPFWGPGPANLVMHTPKVTTLFGPIVLIPILAGHVDDRGKLVRWMILVPAICGILFAALKANLLLVFAYPIGVDIAFPLHQAARLVMGGRFFERTEGLWLFVWVMSTIVLLGALLYGSALAFCRAFRIPKHRSAVLPLAAVVLTLAFFPPDQATTITWYENASPVLFTITLLIPAVLALVAIFRLRRA